MDRLLSAYEQAGKGNINVVRFDTRSDTNLTLAAKDGIQAFNRDKGDVCFLGLCVVHEGQKELLPRLDPEWEPALESDLSRAIERVSSAAPGPAGARARAAQSDAAAAEEDQAVDPDLASVPVRKELGFSERLH